MKPRPVGAGLHAGAGCFNGMAKKSGKKKQAKPSRSQAPPKAPPTRLEWWLLLLLSLAAFVTFVQTLSYELVYDDEYQILRNPWIRSWADVGRFFTANVWAFYNTDDTPSNYYRPLHMAVHALGYTISGMAPYGYHLINVLLHCACTVLVALFGLRLTGSRPASVAAGLIFALHPVHVESVAWVAGVTDPLCAIFYFGALYIHLKSSQQSDNRAATPIIGMLFMGALLSKEMAFTLPAAMLWLDWRLRAKIRWQRYALLAGVFAVYAAMRISALSSFHVVQNPIDMSGRAFSMVVLMAQYVTKAFIPYDLNAFHVFRPTTSIIDPRFVAATLALLLFAFAAWRLRTDRKMIFLLGFVVLSLLPVMNISGVGENVFADRYLYLPSLGSSLVFALAAGKLWRLRPSWFQWDERKAAALALAALLLAFGWVLAGTTGMWRDTETLYTETLKRSPQAGLIARSLARYYFDRGQYNEAEQMLRVAMDISARSGSQKPGDQAAIHAALGGIYLFRGNTSQAAEYLFKSYQIAPRNAYTLQNLGALYLTVGDLDEARKYLEAAVEVNPRNEAAYNNLSYVFNTKQDYDKAIEYARQALRIFPDFGDAHLNLARAYAGKGMIEQAQQAYMRSRQLNPKDAAAIDQELKALGERRP